MDKYYANQLLWNYIEKLNTEKTNMQNYSNNLNSNYSADEVGYINNSIAQVISEMSTIINSLESMRQEILSMQIDEE